MKANLTEARPVTRQVGPDGVSLKKQGPSHHPDRSGSLVLRLHLTAGSYDDPILSFKTSLHGFDLALMVGLTGSTHHPDGLECGQRALMTKLGEGHPFSWYCIGEEQVAQLLRRCCHPPQNKNGVSQVDAKESSDETWPRSDGERTLKWLKDEEEAWAVDPVGSGMIRRWGGDRLERPLSEERRRRALGGTPLGHMADLEWLGIVTWV